MALQNLKDVNASSDSPVSTPPQKFGDYFILITKILAGFIAFGWLTTSNYLNSLHINTDESYPVFGKVEVVKAGNKVERSNESILRKKGLSRFENLGLTTPAESMSNQYVENVDNPYATWFNPGTINMSDEDEIKEKVNMKWWLERTQQSSYQMGGLILHYVFNGLNGLVQVIDPNKAVPNKTDPIKTSPSASLVQFFSFIIWIVFGIGSIALFALLLVLVFFMWIPGFLGGLTAFMPWAYYTASPILQLYKKGLILLLTFAWMCVFGFVTGFPVIYEFGYLLYLMIFKQIKDDGSRFITELMKRMKQLVFIYVLVAVIIAFASKDFPNETKYAIAGVLCVSLFYVLYNIYM
uniref:Uncharacterized protein n=1 Tax=viral metagenome TaxID=1070528 RepID=A0A6C0I5E8_9ZZZZ